MKTEIEAKFLSVDFGALRQKLTELGATLEQPMRLMRRVIIEPAELATQDAFIRIRDEGDKVTLTYKQFQEKSLTGAREIEVVVSNFEDTIAIFDKVGLTHKSYQESRRETWRLDDVEVVLDEWPWLKPYIEIEGSHEDHVKNVAVKLGFDWDEVVFGGVTTAYGMQYPDGDANKLVTLPEILFDSLVPDIISGHTSGS